MTGSVIRGEEGCDSTGNDPSSTFVPDVAEHGDCAEPGVLTSLPRRAKFDYACTANWSPAELENWGRSLSYGPWPRVSRGARVVIGKGLDRWKPVKAIRHGALGGTALTGRMPRESSEVRMFVRSLRAGEIAKNVVLWIAAQGRPIGRERECVCVEEKGEISILL